MTKKFEPLFATPKAEQSREETNKADSQGMSGTLYEEYRDTNREDLSWEAEQISKSYGIYLEFNRALGTRNKQWMYMIRLGIPGGGPITPLQWRVLDELAEDYARDPEGQPSIRLTTRQNVQFHWVKKQDVVPLIRRAAEAGLLSLNGCGDNVRNIMSCPLGPKSEVFNPQLFAAESARYFQLPSGPFIKIFEVDPIHLEQSHETFKYGPQLLNRKFKMAFTTVHRDPHTGILVPDNCVEMRTHDLGVAPVTDGVRITDFQIYVGGGQGERNGKPSAAMLALPLARVSEAQLWNVMDAIVATHQEWGDRKNRHWARLKYVIKKQGIDWFREKVQNRLGYDLEDPDLDLDIGARHLHHGWQQQPDGKLAYGAFIENGRLKDHGPTGDLKAMVRTLSERYQTPLMITPNQDLLFTDIPVAQRGAFERDLLAFGQGHREGQSISTLRRNAGACVGKDTCRLAYTDSERFEPELLSQLEEMGWGEVATSIGITGCERQCYRPATKSFGLIGSGGDRYMLKLFGTEDGRHQGEPLVVDGRTFLRSIPRQKVSVVIDALLRLWRSSAEPGETPGYFLRRLGSGQLIQHLSCDPATSDLLEKATPHLALTV